MTPNLEAAIQRQWTDDEEYVETCRFIELDVEANWQIEARFRSTGAIASFVIEMLRRDWEEVLIVQTPQGGEELVVRREQPLTLEAIKPMTASLLRLAHTYNLDWLNWCEFDGWIYCSLHRMPMNWTIEATD
jgi:hypothetical protein